MHKPLPGIVAEEKPRQSSSSWSKDNNRLRSKHLTDEELQKQTINAENCLYPKSKAYIIPRQTQEP